MQRTGQKPRRFARACDACYRRKVRCDYQSPACAGCSKAGIECKFTIVQRARTKPRPGSDQAHREDANSDSGVVQTIETLDTRRTAGNAAEPRSQRTADHTPNATPGLNIPLTVAKRENGYFTNTLESGTLVGGELVEDVILEYFNHINQVFPVYEKDLFLHKASVASSEHDVRITELSKMFMISAVLLHRKLTSTPGPNVAAEGDQTFSSIQSEALDRLSALLLAPPSLALIQLLILAASCLWTADYGDYRSSVLVAAAVRMAHHLRIHIDFNRGGPNNEFRLGQLRVYWTLYTLDMEISFHNEHPPLINDEDLSIELRMLEPRMFSVDRAGIVSSVDGSSCLNLFSARQRLSRIQRSIQRTLFSVGAIQRGEEGVENAIRRCRLELTEWKEQWFEYGRAADTASNWTRTNVPFILNVQRLYFRCFRRICSRIARSDYLETTTQYLYHQAKVTLEMQEHLQEDAVSTTSEVKLFVVDCLNVMVASMSHERVIDRETLDLVDRWLQRLQILVDDTSDSSLREAASALKHEWNLIERMMGHYGSALG